MGELIIKRRGIWKRAVNGLESVEFEGVVRKSTSVNGREKGKSKNRRQKLYEWFNVGLRWGFDKGGSASDRRAWALVYAVGDAGGGEPGDGGFGADAFCGRCEGNT